MLALLRLRFYRILKYDALVLVYQLLLVQVLKQQKCHIKFASAVDDGQLF